MKTRKFDILIIFVFLFFQVSQVFSQGTASLTVISMPNYPDTAYEGQLYSFDILVKNNTNIAVTTPVFINLRVDTITSVVDSLNQPNINPGDSVLFSISGYEFNLPQYKVGNNIVVVWPVVNSSPSLLIDTFFTDVVFIPLNTVIHPLFEESFAVYPIPAHDFLNLHISGIVSPEYVRIIGYDGRLVKVFKGYPERIDISQLASALYYIEIFADGRYFRRKILKQ